MTHAMAERGVRDGEALCERLFEDTGVAILPGSAFEKPVRELTARVAYVNFDGPKALAASETVPLDRTLPEDFLQTYCRSTVTAVEKIAE